MTLKWKKNNDIINNELWWKNNDNAFVVVLRGQDEHCMPHFHRVSSMCDTGAMPSVYNNRGQFMWTMPCMFHTRGQHMWTMPCVCHTRGQHMWTMPCTYHTRGQHLWTMPCVYQHLWTMCWEYPRGEHLWTMPCMYHTRGQHLWAMSCVYHRGSTGAPDYSSATMWELALWKWSNLPGTVYYIMYIRVSQNTPKSCDRGSHLPH